MSEESCTRAACRDDDASEKIDDGVALALLATTMTSTISVEHKNDDKKKTSICCWRHLVSSLRRFGIRLFFSPLLLRFHARAVSSFSRSGDIYTYICIYRRQYKERQHPTATKTRRRPAEVWAGEKQKRGRSLFYFGAVLSCFFFFFFLKTREL